MSTITSTDPSNRTDSDHHDFNFSQYAKANLGCGDDYRGQPHGSEWLNVDLPGREIGMDGRTVTPDFGYDLDELPWPFPDNCFEHIEMHNVLEHLDDHLAVVKELHRVTEPGGTIVVSGPHWNSASTWIDLTHTRPFDPRSFDHYLVDDLFEMVDLDVVSVRWARPLPDRAALWLADIFGHGVIEFTVTVEVQEVADED